MSTVAGGSKVWPSAVADEFLSAESQNLPTSDPLIFSRRALFVWTADALMTFSSTVAEGFSFLFPAVADVFWFTIADGCLHLASVVMDRFGGLVFDVLSNVCFASAEY